jgi:hypothetical protein
MAISFCVRDWRERAEMGAAADDDDVDVDNAVATAFFFFDLLDVVVLLEVPAVSEVVVMPYSGRW